MLYVIIELSPRMRFNPFNSNGIELFRVYNESQQMARALRTPSVSYYNSYNQAQNHMDRLSSQLNRFLILEMLLKNHYYIPNRARSFNESITSADFHFGGFQTPVVRRHETGMRQENRSRVVGRTSPVVPPVIAPVATPVIPPAIATTPLAHVPKPDAALQNKAHLIATQLGDKLPQECCDPISMDPLTDPIEINKRVYNRDTVTNMIKHGQFEDPFNRDRVNVATAKSAHYMLDAIVQHADAVAGKKPAMLLTKRNTDVYPLRDLLDIWEKLPSQSSASVNVTP